MTQTKNVFVTGGAGYVGAVLVPQLLAKGHRVKVLDLYIYGEDVLNVVKDDPHLIQIKGDIRDRGLLERELAGYDTVIHLACISNDPSYELNPALSKAINYDAFLQLVDVAKQVGVKHFIYASSSSVYGIKDDPEVTEDLPLNSLTDYSKYKAKCEEYLDLQATAEFSVTTIRPATICGYSPRQRFDLTVNILTNHALNKGKITVFGGEQQRPNLHIQDMVDLYLFLLELPPEKIHRKIYNVGYHNYTVRQLAEMVRDTLGGEIPIETTPSDDIRSYHVSSRKIKEELGFEAKHTVPEAILDLHQAFRAGLLPHPLDDIRYYNIKTMLAINLK
ncbi:MAG: NAD-dependent epimerase/dehydratase family protein [Deltaproteobacteria bacterium]|nr:MAG: NAD-dependent epimerase/dehydratase family protein [Deltaproteobacteria bacterium]